MKIFLAIGKGSGFPEPFREVLKCDYFLRGGESRHWLYDPIKEFDESF